MHKTGERVIRAQYDENTITVYQAFRKETALPAVEAQTFVSPPFKMERMTWIKPSFLWMMYRSGWALKEEGKQILKIKITRKGFEEALNQACLSSFHSDIHLNREDWKKELLQSPVRIQWDPERNMYLEPLDYRAIQIGLSGIAVQNYVNQWIVSIENITEEVYHIHNLIKSNPKDPQVVLPQEDYYPINPHLGRRIGIKE